MTPIGQPLIFREEVDSTNSLARTLADEGATHGTAVCARRQTAGRGRNGRNWTTLPGDHVYMSIILRPTLPPERVPELTLVAAVAVAEAIERFGIYTRIKWPNDVHSAGRKIAGILSELSVDAKGGVRYVILGIGINVTQRRETFPEELREIATSIEAVTGRKETSEAVTSAVFECLGLWMDRHSVSLVPVLQTWRRRSSTLGEDVRVTIEGQELVGRAEEIDGTGALLIRTQAGDLHRVIAGDVLNLRPVR